MFAVNGHEDEDDDDEELSLGDRDDDEELDFSDEDDDDDDENVDPTPVYLVTEMNKIENSDPNCTKLEVGVTYEGWGEGCLYIPPASGDWASLGQAIGRSKYLTEFSFISIRGVVSSTLLPPREYY